MVSIKSFVFAIVLLIPCLITGQPAKGMETPGTSNLMYTFGSQEDIPAAFMADASSARNDQPFARKVYRPCQDGSGGLCVTEGECPPELRAGTNSTGACDPGLECCFGPPVSDKSCASRGGECLSPEACGRQPIYKEAVDCDTQRGQICCILTK